MRHKFLVVSFLLSIIYSLSQNLIHNGSFEMTSDCPNGFDHLSLADGWDNPNGGTADLYCSCHGKKWNTAGVPDNHFGTQEAEDGICYAGIMCQRFGDNRKEYLRYTLKNKLEKKEKYCLKFFYSRADYLKLDSKRLGFALSSKKIEGKSYEPFYHPSGSSTIDNDCKKWHQFTGLYEAKGGEKYLMIGSFDDENNFRSVHGDTVPERGKMFYINYVAYFYIDDVSLEKTNDPAACRNDEEVLVDSDGASEEKTKTENTEAEVVRVIVLKNLNFESNKSEILESSFGELDSLAEYLNDEKEMRLHIGGHTDNIGTDAKNTALSRNRALAVFNYLSKKGISGGRMSYEGYGSSRPITSNDTDDGRKQNRRVEISITR